MVKLGRSFEAKDVNLAYLFYPDVKACRYQHPCAMLLPKYIVELKYLMTTYYYTTAFELHLTQTLGNLSDSSLASSVGVRYHA